MRNIKLNYWKILASFKKKKKKKSKVFEPEYTFKYVLSFIQFSDANYSKFLPRETTSYL